MKGEVGKEYLKPMHLGIYCNQTCFSRYSHRERTAAILWLQLAVPSVWHRWSWEEGWENKLLPLKEQVLNNYCTSWTHQKCYKSAFAWGIMHAWIQLCFSASVLFTLKVPFRVPRFAMTSADRTFEVQKWKAQDSPCLWNKPAVSGHLINTVTLYNGKQLAQCSTYSEQDSICLLW